MQATSGPCGALSARERDPELLAEILAALPDLVFVLDGSGRYCAVFGGRDQARYHDGNPLVGRYLHEVLSAEQADAFLARIREALETRQVVTYEYELSQRDVDGVEARDGVADALWFQGRVAPLGPVNGCDDMVVWTLSNITEFRRILEQLAEQRVELERLARTDPLTQLLNRRSFFEEAERELAWVRRTGASAALVALDLDRFKDVNDRWGHAAGDAVLVGVSAALREGRRASDVVGRLGGEEFALVVRGAGREEGAELAERLRARLETLEIVHDGTRIPVTASFGVAELGGGANVESALKRADAAMYAAKRRGRNRVELA